MNRPTPLQRIRAQAHLVNTIANRLATQADKDANAATRHIKGWRRRLHTSNKQHADLLAVAAENSEKLCGLLASDTVLELEFWPSHYAKQVVDHLQARADDGDVEQAEKLLSMIVKETILKSS